MTQSSRNVAVIGLGTFGAAIATELAEIGNHVMGVDTDEARVSTLSRVLKRSIIADAREQSAMEEAGLASYDTVVIAIAASIECSVLATMVAQSLDIDSIWAKANTDTHAKILRRLGVHHVLQPEQEYGTHLAHRLHNDAIQSYVQLGHNKHLAQILVSDSNAGSSVEALKLDDKYGLFVAGLLREGQPLEATAETTVAGGDSLLLIGDHHGIQSAADAL